MYKMQDKKIKLTKTIGKIVKNSRISQNKSISLITAEIGMTKSMWADLEKGIKDPQLSTIIRIAEALNINASELLAELEKELGKEFSLID